MKINEKIAKNIYFAIIVVVSIALRFIPHIPNFVPITAVALFSGVYFKGNLKYIFLFSAMILSDYFLGFHSTMFFVYISLILTVGIGIIISKNRKFANIAIATISSSVIFFLVTNFGVWLTTAWYGPGINGLIDCYIAAIPFFRNSLSSDLFYATIYFGAYSIVLFYLKNERKIYARNQLKSK